LPQAVQAFVAVHVCCVPQVVPTATQSCDARSQHPTAHSSSQQGSPTFPSLLQEMHKPLLQTRPFDVQWLKGGQQGWFGPPQAPHEPLPQTPLSAQKHSSPEARQVDMSQQPPLSQPPSGQQGCPAPPHSLQTLSSQVAFASLHRFPAQQGWLLPPHALHVPASQLCPLVRHDRPAQQG
jgi:hypothetical protein